MKQTFSLKSSLVFLWFNGISLIMVMSASDGIFFWMAMELNSLVFLGFLSSQGVYWAESGVKYFLPNALGGLMYILGLVLTEMSMSSSFSLLSQAGLILKLGVFPAHFWVPAVASKLDYLTLVVFLGPQKLVPLHGLVWGGLGPSCLMGFGAVVGLMASLAGSSKSSLMSILAYSSVISSSWLLCASLLDSYVPYIFLILYVTVVSFLLLTMTSSTSIASLSLHSGLLLVLLSGFPAGPVFLSKWLVLSLVVQSGFFGSGILLSLSVLLSTAMFLKLLLRSGGLSGLLKAPPSHQFLLACVVFFYFYFFFPMELRCPYSPMFSSTSFLLVGV